MKKKINTTKKSKKDISYRELIGCLDGVIGKLPFSALIQIHGMLCGSLAVADNKQDVLEIAKDIDLAEDMMMKLFMVSRKNVK